jgi:hypothetical protein
MEDYLKTTEIPLYLGMQEVSTAKLYKSLSEINELGFTKIESKMSSIFMGLKNNRRTVVIDVTDTYFSGVSLDSMPKKAKEGIIKKLMQIALAVTEGNGFPLMHRIYGGNISNGMIMDDMINDLWVNGYTAIVMDPRMSDPRRIMAIIEPVFSIICGLRKTNEIKKIIDTVDRDDIYTKAHRVKLKSTEVYCKSIEYMNGKMIIVFNPSMEAVKKAHYYEHSSNEDIAGYLGYSIIYHNAKLADSNAVREYYDKDSVEGSFKQIKSILDLRHVRVWLKSHSK